jgi:Cu/Ag efflux pump CusA
MAQPLETKPRQTLMRWIVGTSLNYRFLVVAIGALLMVFGVATLPSTRVDAFPEFAPPRVSSRLPASVFQPPMWSSW